MMVTKESPDSRWPGTIVLPDFMTFPQLRDWQKAMNAARKINELQQAADKDTISIADFYLSILPAATSLVKEWHIEGLPEKVDESVFPASSNLMSWLMDCVNDLYTRTNVSPNS
jgi:hypothetical protein